MPDRDLKRDRVDVQRLGPVHAHGVGAGDQMQVLEGPQVAEVEDRPQVDIEALPPLAGEHLDTPRQVMHGGRVYTFCSEPCQWIFEQNPARYAGHLSIIDRFLAGHIQPPDMAGLRAYMGLCPAEQGTDAMNYSWAFELPQAAVKSVA